MCTLNSLRAVKEEADSVALVNDLIKHGAVAGEMAAAAEAVQGHAAAAAAAAVHAQETGTHLSALHHALGTGTIGGGGNGTGSGRTANEGRFDTEDMLEREDILERESMLPMLLIIMRVGIVRAGAISSDRRLPTEAWPLWSEFSLLKAAVAASAGK